MISNNIYIYIYGVENVGNTIFSFKNEFELIWRSFEAFGGLKILLIIVG
jgi:hypothetical protein